jgi:hypothetical protein
MTQARELDRGDRFPAVIPLRVVSVEHLSNGFVKIRCAMSDTPSLTVCDGSGVVEFICRPYRRFGAGYREPEVASEGPAWRRGCGAVEH